MDEGKWIFFSVKMTLENYADFGTHFSSEESCWKLKLHRLHCICIYLYYQIFYNIFNWYSEALCHLSLKIVFIPWKLNV